MFHLQNDPLLEGYRSELIRTAASALDKAKMVRFVEHTGYLYATDLGRTASNFYIKHDTVEVCEQHRTHGACPSFVNFLAPRYVSYQLSTYALQSGLLLDTRPYAAALIHALVVVRVLALDVTHPFLDVLTRNYSVIRFLW